MRNRIETSIIEQVVQVVVERKAYNQALAHYVVQTHRGFMHGRLAAFSPLELERRNEISLFSNSPRSCCEIVLQPYLPAYYLLCEQTETSSLYRQE